MPFLRVTRDRHGHETTLLLHAAAPGERPRVLYVYRTAPDVRIGRQALDEEAIRLIEERHPDVDFDWTHLIETASVVGAEPERRVKKRRRGRDEGMEANGGEEPMPPVMHAAEHAVLAAADAEAQARDQAQARGRAPRRMSALLDELVGREIASRLRQRHAELARAVASAPAGDDADTLRARVASIDPDAWATPEQILEGVERAEREYDAIKDELLAAPAPAPPPTDPV